MTHEPKFGCRWAIIRVDQESDPPIMAEDDEGSFVLYEHFAAQRAQLEAVTKERDQWKTITDNGIHDLCDFEKEMEEKHGLEFTDDYGGVWQGEAVTKKITALEQALQTAVQEREALQTTSVNHRETLAGIAAMDAQEGRRMQQWAQDALSGYVEPVEATVLTLTNQLNASQRRAGRLEEALRNCYMLARRSVGKLIVNNDNWEHIKRFCEEAGLQPDGVLRAPPAAPGTPEEQP